MEYKKLPITQVKLDYENPRIKQCLEIYGEEITSDMLALALSNPGNGSDTSSSYSALKDSIRSNKGIIFPIIVNHQDNGDYVVIEGNTRLQIYKEFSVVDPEGPWNEIISIVHENLPIEEIHAIRLQTHLVGPRDWDPFSKAKYLNQLANIDKMPLNLVISYCGGKRPEIEKLLAAYGDMLKHYKPAVEKFGIDFDPKDFSKFAELQNRSIQDALIVHKYTKDDFAEWVVNRNIDTAQNVRKLPEILSNKQATSVFLKSNITNAMKYVHVNSKNVGNLDNFTLDELIVATINKIRNITLKEYNALKLDPDFDKQKNNLLDLRDELNTLADELLV